jgi:hypothetical protein
MIKLPKPTREVLPEPTREVVSDTMPAIPARSCPRLDPRGRHRGPSAAPAAEVKAGRKAR